MHFIFEPFLMNDISDLVFFDSGVTRSIILLALRKRFFGAPWELDFQLDVEITYDRYVWVARVHRVCTLQLFSEQYVVILVPIHLHGNKVIVGMDWLGPNRVVIDCEWQLVWVQTLSGGEFVVHWERSQLWLIWCSTARARRSFQQGYSGFVSFVMDTRDKSKTNMDDFLIV